MGNNSSTVANVLQDERNLYIKVNEYRNEKGRGLSMNFVVFEFCVRHKRWKWTIVKRYGEVKSLHKLLLKHHTKDVPNLCDIKFPGAIYRLFGKMTDEHLQLRAQDLAIYMQALASIPAIFESPHFKMFLEVGNVRSNRYLFFAPSLMDYCCFCRRRCCQPWVARARRGT